MLSFTWEDLDKVLDELAVSEAQRDKSRQIVRSIRRKQTEYGLERDQVLKQILVAAWLAMEGDGDLIVKELEGINSAVRSGG